MLHTSYLCIETFLSTPSARRATWKKDNSLCVPKISIHALREEGDCIPPTAANDGVDFYPRPPRGGRRPNNCLTMRSFLFLSTPSARRATGRDAEPPRRERISIHALREEGDAVACAVAFRQIHFYPRPPRGGRPIGSKDWNGNPKFLSTPSARRATGRGGQCGGNQSISIHALREEGDWASWLLCWPSLHFYPRPPRGGRRQRPLRAQTAQGISIHALREEGD